MHHTNLILIRVAPLLILLPTACAQPWTPPERSTELPPPDIYLRTSEGLVPITSQQAAEHARQEMRSSIQNAGDNNRAGEKHSTANWRLPAADADSMMSPFWAESLSRPRIAVESIGPTQNQPYYTRGEHTSRGYVEGHYRREGDYIRGEQTPAGYIRGSYLGSGDYVRGEHTSKGYIPGHYRSVPQPSGTQSSKSTSPSSGASNFQLRQLP